MVLLSAGPSVVDGGAGAVVGVGDVSVFVRGTPVLAGMFRTSGRRPGLRRGPGMLARTVVRNYSGVVQPGSTRACHTPSIG